MKDNYYRPEHNRYQYEMTTSGANHRLRWMRNLLAKVDQDPERKQRLDESLCPMCYYEKSRIGGARITQALCAAGCETVLNSGNTNINILCLACAKSRGCCAHCGADVNLKRRRKLNF